MFKADGVAVADGVEVSVKVDVGVGGIEVGVSCGAGDVGED